MERVNKEQWGRLAAHGAHKLLFNSVILFHFTHDFFFLNISSVLPQTLLSTDNLLILNREQRSHKSYIHPNTKSSRLLISVHFFLLLLKKKKCFKQYFLNYNKRSALLNQWIMIMCAQELIQIYLLKGFMSCVIPLFPISSSSIVLFLSVYKHNQFKNSHH